MSNYYDEAERQMAIAATWYNLADKSNFAEWTACIEQLQASGANTEEATQKAIDICHGRAQLVNPKKEVVVAAQEVKQVRYKTKFGQMLSGCESLDDYINLGGVA